MAYDERLGKQVTAILSSEHNLSIKKMFGGLGFLLDGNMACGVLKDLLIVRVCPENYETALQLPGSEKFGNGGRAMKGWLAISADKITEPEQLTTWIARGVAYARQLPPK